LDSLKRLWASWGFVKGKTEPKFRPTLSDTLFGAILVGVGVASMSRLSWISPSVHLARPFTSGTFDLTYAAILGLGILVVASAATLVSYRPVRLKSLFWVETGLVVGLGIAVFWAGDKRVAANVATGLVVGLVLMHATAWLVDRPWKLRLSLVVVMSLGAVFAVKTWKLEIHELEDMRRSYLEIREDLWASRGMSLDDPQVKMVEKRLLGRGKAGGFFVHPNLGAAFLATVLMVSLAAVAMRIREPPGRSRVIWLLLQLGLCALIASALLLTRSKGGMTAAALGLLSVVLLRGFSSLLAKNVKVSAAILAGLVVIGILGVLGYGMIVGKLPTKSLANRWQYWTAGVGMFRDHPLVGVGPGNFGYHYLRYKPIHAAETVTSPHNFVVQGLAEMGLVGGVALILLPFVILYGIAARASEPPRASPNRTGAPLGQPRTVTTGALTAIALFSIVLLFNQMGVRTPAGFLGIYWPYLLTFALSFLLGAVGRGRLGSTAQGPILEGRLCHGTTLMWLSGALVTFVAGNLINFSIFEPSLQFLFFFICGVTLAGARAENSSVDRTRRPVLFVVMAAFALSYLFWVLIPAARSERVVDRAQRIRTAAVPEMDPPFRDLLGAAKSARWDPHLPARAADRLLWAINRPAPHHSRWVIQAEELYGLATDRAPVIFRYHHARARCYLVLARLKPSSKWEMLKRSEALFERALVLAPLSSSIQMQAGLTYWQHVQTMPASERKQRSLLARKARTHLQTSLNLNRMLPRQSPMRFTRRDHHRIQQALREVEPLGREK
jgi:hypothetical protein